MLCNVCQKKAATVHLTEIVDEKIVELHLCQDCAQSKSSLVQEHFNLSDFLGGFVDEDTEKSRRIKCKECGLNYYDFKKKGRLGCKNCYRDFRPLLLPLLKRIHGSTQHQGKSPQSSKKEAPVNFRINGLKQELKKAIELEEYEKAADLRDQIKKLESREDPGY